MLRLVVLLVAIMPHTQEEGQRCHSVYALRKECAFATASGIAQTLSSPMLSSPGICWPGGSRD